MPIHRLEALSDGVFAIVFTILVLELRVPEELHDAAHELIPALLELGPVFLGYVVSFAVLAMFWISHNFLYDMIVKNVNRQMAVLNILYLAIVSLIPFSAHLLGRYVEVPLAVQLYGLNVIAIGLLVVLIFEYALASDEIDTSHNDRRTILMVRTRLYLVPTITLLGIIVSFVSIPAALFLYAYPVFFNVIPGLLTKTERLLGVRFGE